MSAINGPLISIVVPIYNAEPYLDRCITSIVNQTYEHIEIILVDDGSQDGCPAMCDAWARRDKRIQVVHKKNAGVGMARNTGIDRATGDYICFFDSDDYIRWDAIECIVGRIMETGAELVAFGFASVNTQGEIVSHVIPFAPKKVYTDNEVCDQFLSTFVFADQEMNGKYNLRLSGWSFCYSNSLIARSGWRFVSERKIISEDAYSLLELFAFAGSVSVLSESLYRFCACPRSLTHVYRQDRLAMLLRFYKVCVELCNRYNYDDAVRRRLAYPFTSYLIAGMKQTAAQGGWDGYRDIKRALGSDEVSAALADINMGVQPPARRLLLELARRRCAFLVWLLSGIKGSKE